MEKLEKFADTSSESHSAGDSQTGEIVLAKFEALTSQNSSSSHGAGEHLDEQVLGYLEVQPSDLHVVQDNNTIYLQPQEIEIDGQHLILTQGDEAGEIIVVVSTDHENPSEQTVAELAQGAMVNAGVMTADSGEKTHTLVVSSTQSTPHIEVLDNNIVGTSESSDDGTKKHAQIVIEEAPFGQVSTSHSKTNDKTSSELLRTLDQKPCHSERTVKIVTSTGINWSVPEEKTTDRKEMKAEMLFIPASSTVSQSSGIPSILLSPSGEEGKDRRLMQLACIAQELQSKNHSEDNSSQRTKELDIEEPSTSQSITRQIDMVDSVTSAGNLEEHEMLPSLSSKNSEGVSSTSVASESQESHIRKPINSVNSLHLHTGSEVSSSNQLSEPGDVSSINSQTHSTSASLILPQEVDSTISEKVLFSEENAVRETNRKPDNSVSDGNTFISDHCEREVAASSRSQDLERRNETTSSVYKECDIISFDTHYCAKAESTPLLIEAADTLRNKKPHSSQEDSGGGITTSVSSSSSQSPVNADMHIIRDRNTSTKKACTRTDFEIEQVEDSSDADSISIVTSLSSPFMEVDNRKPLPDKGLTEQNSSLNMLCLSPGNSDFKIRSDANNAGSSADCNFNDSRGEILAQNFLVKSHKEDETVTSDNSNKEINESFVDIKTLPTFLQLDAPSSEHVAHDGGAEVYTYTTTKQNNISPDTLTDRDGKSTSSLGTQENQQFQDNERLNVNIEENLNVSSLELNKQNSSQETNLLFPSQDSGVTATSSQPIQIDQVYCSNLLNKSEINENNTWKEVQSVQNEQTSSSHIDMEDKLKEFDSCMQDKFKHSSNTSIQCHDTSVSNSENIQERALITEENIVLSHKKTSEKTQLDSFEESIKLGKEFFLHPTCAVENKQVSQQEENILKEPNKPDKNLQESTLRVKDVYTRKIDEISTSESEEKYPYCFDIPYNKGIEPQKEMFEDVEKKNSQNDKLASCSGTDDTIGELEKPLNDKITEMEQTCRKLGYMDSQSSGNDLPRPLYCNPVKDKNALDIDSIYTFNEVDSSTSEYETMKETDCSNISVSFETHEDTMPVIQPVMSEYLDDQTPKLEHVSSVSVSYETSMHSLVSTSGYQKPDIKSNESYLDKKQQPSSPIISNPSKGGAKQIIFNPMKCVSPLPSKLGTRTSSPTIIRITPECKKAESVQQIQEVISESIHPDLLIERQVDVPECNSSTSYKEDPITAHISQDKDVLQIQKALQMVHPSSDKPCLAFEENDNCSDTMNSFESDISNKTQSLQDDENCFFEKNETITSKQTEALHSETSTEQTANLKTLHKKHLRQRKTSSTKDITVQLETQSRKERKLQVDSSPLKKNDDKIRNVTTSLDLDNQSKELPSSSRDFDTIPEMPKKRDNKRKMSNENALLSSEIKKGKVDLFEKVVEKERCILDNEDNNEMPVLESSMEVPRNIDQSLDAESQSRKRRVDNLNTDDSGGKKLKEVLKYTSDKHNTKKGQNVVPDSDPINFGLDEKDAKDPIRSKSVQDVVQTGTVSPSKKGRPRSNTVSPRGGGRRHIHSSAAFDALRKQSKVLCTPPKFSRRYFELKHSRTRSLPSVQKETTLVTMPVPQISPLKHCDIRIRCQTPSSPEKPSSTYQCVNCRFTTSRVENLIQHYKEKCLYDNSDIFEWGIEDMDRRQRIRGEEPKENGCALDYKQLTNQNSNSKVYNDVSGSLKVPESNEQSEGVVNDSDSDSDGLLTSSTQTINKFGFVEGDVVWVDWRRLHWPALVRRINHKEKRVSVMFIDTPTNKNGIKVGVKKIQSFNNAERNKKYLSEGRSTTFGESLVKAVQKAEDFLRKRCLGISVSAAQFFESFDDPDYLSDVGSSVSSPSETGKAAQEQRLLEVSSDHGSPLLSPEESHVVEDIPKDGASDSTNSEVSVKRKQRRNQNAKLLQCIKDGKVETHLLGVYRNTIPSDRHSKFNSLLASERNQLKHQLWFGPIDDEEQQEEIYEYCLHLFKSNFEYGESFDVVAYVFEVWVPEAIVKAISRLRRVTMSEAEELFARGVQWSKTDVEEPEKELTFAEEDQQEYRDRMILKMRDAGIVEEINQTLAM